MYRDKNGKPISDPEKLKEFVNEYPNEYLKILKQQFENAIPESVLGNVKTEVKRKSWFSNKIKSIKFIYNGKEVNKLVPVDVEKVITELGIETKNS